MKNKYVLVTIIALIIVIIFTLPLFNMFTITEAESGRIVFASKAYDNEEFYTSFIHSVNKTPVYEYYKIVDNGFIIYKTSFYSYGAGMPDYEDYHEKPEIKDGLVQIENLNIKMDSFSLFVGRIANHQLHIDGKIYKLSDFIEPGKTACFDIKKVSLYALLRRLNNE